jgi:hypothetical protein
MPGFESEFITIGESENVIHCAISEGETLLNYGTGDLSEIVSWFNLAQVALEMVPACLDSLQTLCFDWRQSNRERVEIAVSILRDAARKIRNPLYFGVYEPSPEYRMLIERVSRGSSVVGDFQYSAHF